MNRVLFGVSLVLLCLVHGCKRPDDFQFKSIGGITPLQLGGGKTGVTFTLNLHNPNKQKVVLKKIYCNVLVEGDTIGKVESDGVFNIPANADFSYPCKMEANQDVMMKYMFRFMRRDSLALRASGKARVGKYGIYFNKAFDYRIKGVF